MFYYLRDETASSEYSLWHRNRLCSLLLTDLPCEIFTFRLFADGGSFGNCALSLLRIMGIQVYPTLDSFGLLSSAFRRCGKVFLVFLLVGYGMRFFSPRKSLECAIHAFNSLDKEFSSFLFYLTIRGSFFFFLFIIRAGE